MVALSMPCPPASPPHIAVLGRDTGGRMHADRSAGFEHHTMPLAIRLPPGGPA
ncbi:hypothetical protein GXY_13218 [Novacetimonas hansenii ATCC 23769]|uniref:Uncharacterized protein n=1 Tax=Novacetimonas hansenii ATCC 23769 TaxID=714995 RepID=D5QHL5_NOVHA|nr:hypothetical protein GXY_13218 [Novacetimonas hansenii ATCC 23769]